MKFSVKNFLSQERKFLSGLVIGLIKSFSFVCEFDTYRIAPFPRKCSAFRPLAAAGAVVLIIQ